MTARRGFDYVGFVDAAGLGEVVAANYFTVQNVSVVPANGAESVSVKGLGMALAVGGAALVAALL